jgi:hypothetical protein
MQLRDAGRVIAIATASESGSDRIKRLVDGNLEDRRSIIGLHAACYLLIVIITVMSGCIQPPTKTVAQPPPYHFQPETLRALDEGIFTASVEARHESEAYARVAMEEWLWRVRQRIDEDFIPWYSSYGIKQWMTAKVVAFKLLYTEGRATPEERLVSYLQEQFYEQVLEPVSSFVDPQTVMEDAAVNYLRELRERLDRLPSEYDVPAAAFRQHLETIPAIVVQAVPPQEASLNEVLQAADLSALPAYRALLKKVAAASDVANPTPSADRLQVVANQAVTRLLDSVTLSAGTATASTLVGGYWGIAISAGSAAYAAVEHDHEKPAIEAQLRENLDAVLDLMWQELVDDPRGGITALVHSMSTQIEDAVAQGYRRGAGDDASRTPGSNKPGATPQ